MIEEEKNVIEKAKADVDEQYANARKELIDSKNAVERSDLEINNLNQEQEALRAALENAKNEETRQRELLSEQSRMGQFAAPPLI